MTTLLMIVALLTVPALLFFVTLIVQARREARRLDDLLAAATDPIPQADLPPPIRVFATRGGADVHCLASSAHLTQESQIRVKRGGEWQDLEARQVITTGEPGFIWTAIKRSGPVTVTRVIDAFVQGVGRLNVRLFGAFTIADSTGADTDRAEAMRYLAELPWAPDAMLGNSALKWRIVGPKAIEVSMPLPQGSAAAVVFLFDDDGDIKEVHAHNRPALDDDGRIVLRDWRCRMWGYDAIGDRRVPTAGEVGYIYEDGYEPYWRGRVTGYATAR